MTIDSVAIGSRIAKERRARKLSQQEVADRLGISRNTYGEYERGAVSPSLKRLDEIATVIDVDVKTFLMPPEARRHRPGKLGKDDGRPPPPSEGDASSFDRAAANRGEG